VTDDGGRRLAVLIGGRRAGSVTMDMAGRLSFTYDEAWRETRTATPLSLSMPLAQQTHGDQTVRAFLWGLLPDNDRVLDRWAQTYQVSANNPFALLRHVGEDCAGAVQFVTTERVEAIMAGANHVDWLTSDEVADRLRILHIDPTAWHVRNSGQFSLAGAQPKTALHYDPDSHRWGDPRGSSPTTHILKPAVTGLDEHDLNEHLCLSAARLMGLVAASSRVESFGEQRVIVVERYDRHRARDGSVTRIHQEDMCQALGLPPTAKYQNEGGPTPEHIIELLRRNVVPARAATASIDRFVDALAFNWIIGGTDAHAKNYSVLLSGPQVRLAPLYDVASALAYDEMYQPRLKMAMKIDDEYRLEAVHGRHWQRFANTNGLDGDTVVARIDHLAEQAPEAFAKAATNESVVSLGSKLPERLVAQLTSRAGQCRERLKS
jgi:serine/threonine-protein kinase HipA